MTCEDYVLTLKRGTGVTVCELVAQADDGEFYRLQILKSTDRKALVKSMVTKLAEVWPSPKFEFEANAARVITKIL